MLRVSCIIQNGNKLRHSNSATSDAKKVKETLRMRFHALHFFVW